MRRRVAAAIPLALMACGAPAGTSSRPETPLSAPARVLALAAADLPGFTLKEELAPVSQAAGDAFGRTASYAATFEGARGQVITSINTYVGIAQAQAAFETWRQAVPRQYRPSSLAVGLGERDGVAYERDGDLLIGYRTRNVLGSVRAPAGDAERLVKLLLKRCAER